MDHVHKGQVTGLHRIAQIGFVDQGHGVLMLGTQVDDGFIFLGQGPGAVADEEYQVGIVHGLFGALNTDGFHGIAGFPDAGGVNEPKAGIPQHNRFFHRIPGGAGDIGDDHPVVAGDGVEQAGLAYVGLAHNGSGHALSENPALVVGLKKSIQSLGIGAEIAVVILQAEILDILVGVIQHCMEMAAQIGQVVIDGGQFLLQHALHLSGGVGGGIGGVCFDQVDDSLCLGQVQLSV